ncbi:sensor histidine kinase [Ktedonospora formicarum]|uniref:histidine kinase n=1 Tax=Ktedonospora formicarum TaxID=2778364 RepID=A0A8J3HV93_9CHLR|nr:HAMP domain-containing sensor histidine kinase [Ktedonospora formicarum]GHO44687.1 hypothetical protein KSX_28500 [Ktedonospora formicarum]
MTQKWTKPERMRWWQSIRWRLAVGSVTVTMLAMLLLVTTAILAALYFYESEQNARLSDTASLNAQRVGVQYSQETLQGQKDVEALRSSAQKVLPAYTLKNVQDQSVVSVILSQNNRIVYPLFLAKATATGPRDGQSRALYTALQRLLDPSQQGRYYSTFRTALAQAHQGKAIAYSPGNGLLPRTFALNPIFAEGREEGEVVGVLLAASRSTIDQTLPQFILNVGGVIAVGLGVIALLAALAAVIYARTITRPLGAMTVATRQMVSGNYSVRVRDPAQGELGELAQTFNEMAAQLHRDVEVLREQELWRRELVMNITHDLATPLTAIAGLGEALVDGVNQSREDYEATGRVIVRETLRLRRLVKDLHVMSKVEAGALHPQQRALRMAALVDETLAVLIPEFERAGVEPRNDIAFDLPQVWADADMVTRVVSNLCDNALQHTSAGGSIVLEARVLNNELLISVTDSGKGIAPEALPKIFERFYRADGSRQSRVGGSGLGLSIVKAIVEAHGGRVWAENVSGAGARIGFTLPLAPVSSAKTKTFPPPMQVQR